ncbi:uncharacterized protein LOC144910200 [Branchiostoma floridae x Branchiostoma belcheri]
MDWRPVAGILLFAALSCCQRVEVQHADLAKRDANECGGTIDGGFGTITSPGFPIEYPNKKRCVWTVRAPPGSFIQMTIGTMQIEPNKDKCNYDSLSITVDGNHNGPYCDANKPPNKLMVGTHFEITFVSDDTVGQQGFLVLYTTIRTPPKQGQDTTEYEKGCTGNLTAGSGILTTPNYPLRYPNNTTCTWTIRTEPGRLAYIQFEIFDLEMSDNCSYDHTMITVDSKRTMGPYCNNMRPPKHPINGSKFEILFKSDAAIEGIGFLLVYNRYPTDQGYQTTTSVPGEVHNYTAVSTERTYTEEDLTTEAHTSESPPTTQSPTDVDTFFEDVSMGFVDNQTVAGSVASKVGTVGGPTDGNDKSKNGVRDKHGAGNTNVGGVVAGITIPLLLIVGAAVAITRLFMKGQSPGQGLRRHTRQKAQDNQNNPPSSSDGGQAGDATYVHVQASESNPTPKQEENPEGDKEEEETVSEAQAAGGEADPADAPPAAPAAPGDTPPAAPAAPEEAATDEKPDAKEEVAAAAAAENQPPATEEENAPEDAHANNATDEEAAPADVPANTVCEEAAPVTAQASNVNCEETAPAATQASNVNYEEAAPVDVKANTTYEEAAPVVTKENTYEEAVPVMSQITVATDDASGEAAGPKPTEEPTPASEAQAAATDVQPPETSDSTGPAEAEPPSDNPNDEQPGTSYTSTQQDGYY